MYATAVAWSYRPGAAAEVRRVEREILMPAARRLAGFRRRWVLPTGADAFLTFALYDSRAEAEAAFAALAPLIRAHLGPLIEAMQRYGGEVEIEACAVRQIGGGSRF